MQNGIGFDQMSGENREQRDQPGPDRTLLGLIAWAGRDPGLTPPSKAVLLAVMAHAYEDGTCSASDHALARASHTSVPTVQRALRIFEGERAIERAQHPRGGRSIRLITREQPPVVDVVDLDNFQKGRTKQQQQDALNGSSPVSSPKSGRSSDPSSVPDPEVERLVTLLTVRNVTEKVARRLVKEYPERIASQVEAHPHRNVQDPAASLVVAIRDDWPTDPPRPQVIARDARPQGREVRDDEQQAALDAQAGLKARERDEEEKVRLFWDGLSQDERESFDEEAIEASPHRDEIRSLSPQSPIFPGLKSAARWEHVRRKLGMEVRG